MPDHSLIDDVVYSLERALNKAGMSVSELSRLSGVSRPYLHRVLHHKHSPTMEKLEQIMKPLGLTIKIVKPRTKPDAHK